MSYEYVVDANANRVNGGQLKTTGVTVSAGQVIAVAVPADEVWTVNGSATNASGGTTPYTQSGVTLNVGSLVGSVDNGKSYFGLGTRAEIPVLVNSGTLSLGCWNGSGGNSSGSITATVSILTPVKL